MNNFDFSALMRSRLFWYAVSASSAAILAVAPVAGKWNRAATEIGFVGSAISLGAAYWLGKDAEIQITNLSIHRHIQGQMEIDMMTHNLNELRAINYQEIALMIGTEDRLQLPGLPTLPQLPGGAIAQLPAAQPQQEYFATEDLAELMAAAATKREDAGSVLITCPKGTGKSNLLRSAIYKLHELTQGNVDFSVINGKEDRDESGNITSTFCGLEKSRSDYINSRRTENIREVSSRLEAITQVMEKRNGGCPMIQILDEWNNTLITASIYDDYMRDEGDKDNPPEDRIKPLLTLGIVLRATQGRSKLVGDWITSHSPLVKDLEINTQYQQSFTFVVLGRGNKLDAIHGALKGNGIVKNERLRVELKKQFEQWEALGLNVPDRVVALTNLGGTWRIVYLPHYPDHQPPITRQAHNQSTEEMLADDTATPPHNSGAFTADLRRNIGNVPASSREDTGNIPQIPDRQQIEALEALLELECTDREQIEPLAKGKQNLPKSDYERYLAIRKGRKSGKSKTELIQSVFGVSGGGNGLDKWRDEFDSLIVRFGGDWIASLIATGHCHEQIIDQCFAVGVARQADFKRRFPQTWQKYINHIEKVAKGG